MRGKWVIGCLLALMGTQSFAADWGGFYAGVNGGYTSMNSSWFDQDYYWSGGTYKTKSDGATLGVQFGWNVQKGNTVLGLETDYRTGSLKTFADQNSMTFKDELKSLITLRTRFGLAIDQSLVYGTLGAARGYSWHSWQDLPQRAKFGNYKIGVAYGFGVERRISDRLSLKGEYLAVRLPAVTGRVTSGGDDFEVSNNVSTIGLGLNYHF